MIHSDDDDDDDDELSDGGDDNLNADEQRSHDTVNYAESDTSDEEVCMSCVCR